MHDLSKFSKIYLVPLGDFHLGYQGIEMEKVKGYIDWIKNHDNARTILMGDLMDCATKTSATELFDSLTTPDQAYAQIRELLQPVRNKILMIVRGNHEEAIYRQVGCDYMARLAYDLGDIPYKPDGGMVGVRLSSDGGVHNIMAYIYATHGWGGARTIGAKVKKAQDLTLCANADIYLLAHDHTANVNRGNILEPPRSKVKFNSRGSYMTVGRKLFINTGGFITYGGYVQRKGLTPQDCGPPRILIEAKREGKTSELKLDLHASL